LAWLKPEDHPKAQEPPFWVTTWLALWVLVGEASRQRVAKLAEGRLIGGDDEQA
jgi:hypothetical protein